MITGKVMVRFTEIFIPYFTNGKWGTSATNMYIRVNEITSAKIWLSFSFNASPQEDGVIVLRTILQKFENRCNFNLAFTP